mgnify:CR=1 FL=1
MIVFRKIALTLLGLLTLIGCKDEPGKSKTEENNFEKIPTKNNPEIGIKLFFPLLKK